MEEESKEHRNVALLHVGNARDVCNRSDEDTTDLNNIHVDKNEGNQEFPDLADENDNLVLDEADVPGIDEYLSYFFSDSAQNDNEEEQNPLYVNGKCVEIGRDANRRFVCSLCDKSFRLKHNLEYHMVIHTGEKSYICGICKRPFAHRHHLTQHMLTHADKSTVPMHWCTICGRGFLQGYNLTRHLRVHTGERRFPCFICNKFFTNAWALQNHLMIHTDDRPFSCKTCSRGFRKKCHLQRHVKTRACYTSKRNRRRKRAKVCNQQNVNHQRVTRSKSKLSGGSIRLNGKIVCEKCDESFTSQVKFKNHDCAYVAPRYSTRQTRKRKETVANAESENDEDICDDNDNDEDYLVSDDDDDDDDDDDADEDSNNDEDYSEELDDDNEFSNEDNGNDIANTSDDGEVNSDLDNDNDSATDEVGGDDGDDYDDFADEITDTDDDDDDRVDTKEIIIKQDDDS